MYCDSITKSMTNCHPLTDFLGFADVLSIPSIKTELRAYLRSNKWSVNPERLAKFTANEMVPKEAEQYLKHVVDDEMPLALKKYLELKMPLVPQPPPSPLGQSSSPPKHQCSPSSPCTIRLSEIGKCWHAFPKGSFKARFAPPAVPRSVLHHFDTHPFFWSWTTKAGPNAGKSFAVPTVPTSCPKDSPKAIQWVISIFHAFKAQLAPQALDPETGRVLPSYVKIYQSNMLMHLRAQRAHPKASKPPPSPAPRAPTRPVAPIPSKSPGVIAELHAEIAALRNEVQALRTLHEASLLAPHSPHTAPTVVPPHSPTHSSSSSSMSIVQEHTAHPEHQWLQVILDYP